MPQFWLEPFGTTNPPRRMDPDWITAEGVDIERWEILSGPSARNPPKMGRGDQLIFHAVGHARMFGAGEILETPRYSTHPVWKERFPWVYPVRVETWIPIVTDGLRTSELVSKRVLGRLQAGAPYVDLTREEFEALRDALKGLASARFHE